MRIVIAGAGDVGKYLAKMFRSESHDIIIIDNNPQNLETLSSRFDIMTYEGNVTFMKDLMEVGVNKCDLFVAVTSHETVNMTACILASSLGAKKTLARVDNHEYIQPDNLRRFSKLGINQMIYPERLAAEEILMSLKTNWQRINMSFCNDSLQLIGVKLRSNAPVIGQQFNTGFLDHGKFRVVAIKRSGNTIIPRGEDELKDGDIVYFIVPPENLEFTREQAGKDEREIRRILIMGGTRIGINTAKLLPDNISAKILESDMDKCSPITQQVRSNILVINIDARDLESLESEGIKDTDAFIAVTENTEENILACLAAKHYGVTKTIAEVENNDYIQLAQNLDIGTVINKKLIAASHIYQMTLNESVQNVTCVPLSSDAQVIEFEAKAGSKVTKHKLRELRIDSDVNFGGYVRDGKGYICSGNTEIQPGDHVIVFCLADAVHSVEPLFN